MAGIQYINHQANNPISGDMRKNYQTGQMEVYNGMTWTTITINPGWVEQEKLAISISHALLEIESYIKEDYSDNVAINDAYQEWRAATEKFCVIATMAEK